MWGRTAQQVLSLDAIGHREFVSEFGGVEVEVTKMEVDRGVEALSVAEAACGPLGAPNKRNLEENEMKKLICIGVVVMLATVATPAVAAGWTCNTTCRDTHGFEYIRVSYGSTPDQAYQNLSCQAGDTVSGEINCWEDSGPAPESPPVN